MKLMIYDYETLNCMSLPEGKMLGLTDREPRRQKPPSENDIKNVLLCQEGSKLCWLPFTCCKCVLKWGGGRKLISYVNIDI